MRGYGLLAIARSDDEMVEFSEPGNGVVQDEEVHPEFLLLLDGHHCDTELILRFEQHYCRPVGINEPVRTLVREIYDLILRHAKGIDAIIRTPALHEPFEHFSERGIALQFVREQIHIRSAFFHSNVVDECGFNLREYVSRRGNSSLSVRGTDFQNMNALQKVFSMAEPFPKAHGILLCSRSARSVVEVSIRILTHSSPVRQ